MFWYMPCFILTTCFGIAATILNDRPILGILAQEAKINSPGDTYIPASYVKWIESSGARVVPIRVREPYSYYESVFNSINGVLFPGGGVSVVTSAYAKAGKILYDLAIEANKKGDYFPVWGTCLGFELLVTITAEKRVLSSVAAKDISLPLDFVIGANKSRLYGYVTDDIQRYLTKENVTANFHNWGLTPKNYSQNDKLKNFYRVLTTNFDKNGKKFISSIEAYDYPIYGLQFHPEKNNYIWNVKYNLPHGPDGIKVSHYFSDFLVSEARKSNHKFPDIQREIDAMIYNYQPVFSRKSDFQQKYYFNYSKPLNSHL